MIVNIANSSSEEYSVSIHEEQHKEECPKFPINKCEVGSISHEAIVAHRDLALVQ